MRAYVDSSVILTILFQESGWTRWKKIFSSFEDCLSSSLTEAEVLATALRENLDLHLAGKALQTVSLIFPERSLQKECLQILKNGYCHGADLWHVANALYLDPQASHLVFISADDRQRQIAHLAGFRLS